MWVDAWYNGWWEDPMWAEEYVRPSTARGIRAAQVGGCGVWDQPEYIGTII